MSGILLHPLLWHLCAAALYTTLALRFWRSRQGVASLAQAPAQRQSGERGLLLAALTLHGLTLSQELFGEGGMRFGFSLALSLMLWLALVLYWIESFYARMEGLQMLGLPLAAVCVMLPVLFPGQRLLFNVDSLAFRTHFLIAMLAYSLFTLAALHALLMAVAEKRLHSGRVSPLMVSLPPLMTMESMLFRLIHVAFLLLTLTVISGVFFAELLFGKPLPLDHKTIFAIIAWFIFAALLLGRHLRGWRGRQALRWTLAGFVALMLAYVGSRFVIEVILGRAA